jgi:hypothetical protein
MPAGSPADAEGMFELDIPFAMAVTAISAIVGGHVGTSCATWLRREVAPALARSRRRD